MESSSRVPWSPEEKAREGRSSGGGTSEMLSVVGAGEMWSGGGAGERRAATTWERRAGDASEGASGGEGSGQERDVRGGNRRSLSKEKYEASIYLFVWILVRSWKR